MRRLVVGVLVAVWGCSSPSEPKGITRGWADGTWVGVRFNGASFPYRDGSSYPFTQYDSLIVMVIDWSSPPSASVYPYARVVSGPDRSERLVCAETFGLVTISPAGLATAPRGGTTQVGACNANWATVQGVRKGDSLVGTWLGKPVTLVRR